MRRVLLVASFHKWRNWGTKGYMTYPVTQLVSHRAGIWIREGRLLTMLFDSLSSTLDWPPLAWIGLKVSHWCLLSSIGPCPRQAPKVFIIIIILHVIHQVQLAWVFFLKYKSSLVISLLKPHQLSISPGSHFMFRVLQELALLNLPSFTLEHFPLCTSSLSIGNHLPPVVPGIPETSFQLCFFPSEATLSGMTTLPLLVDHYCSPFQSHLRYCPLWGALHKPSPPPPIRVDSLLCMHRAFTIHVVVANMSSSAGSGYCKGSCIKIVHFISSTNPGGDIVDA